MGALTVSSQGTTHTVASALRIAETTLAASATAASDARELVSRLLGVGRADALLARGRELTQDQWQQLERWLKRRVAGEPVAYVTGRAAFRNLDLAVTPSVLVPRPETEGLVERVIEKLAHHAWRAPRVLDLGTGSGAIALAIASEWPRARIVATDHSEAALEVARGNAAAIGLEAMVEFRSGDWFEPIAADERFEIVVSNPPYIATGEWDSLPDDVRRFEPQEALFAGSTGLDALREIIDEAPQHLVAGGWLALELAEMRAAEVSAWLEGATEWQAVRVNDDLSGRPRVLLAQRTQGPAIAPLQWPEER